MWTVRFLHNNYVVYGKVSGVKPVTESTHQLNKPTIHLTPQTLKLSFVTYRLPPCAYVYLVSLLRDRHAKLTNRCCVK